MAKAPWARFTKFISPRVTASPQASTNSSMPYAMASNRIVNMVVTMGAGPRSMNDNHPQLLHGQRAGLSVSQIAVRRSQDLTEASLIHTDFPPWTGPQPAHFFVLPGSLTASKVWNSTL